MKYLLILILFAGCTPPHEKSRLQEKLRCLDEATAAATGALDLLLYQNSNHLLNEDDDIVSLNYVQLVNKNATAACEAP